LAPPTRRLVSWDRAIEAGLDALEATRLAGSRLGEAATLDGLGVSYHRIGRIEQAVDCLRRAVDLQQELAEAQGEALTLEHLASVLCAAGEETDARICDDRARAIYASLQLIRDMPVEEGEQGLVMRKLHWEA
jgi:tetratricopeptide (TPR) repeat protein